MEKEMTTKEKIIFESLKLFSGKGYDGVSMREIAAAVGIKGASIYNHFSGKDEFTVMFRKLLISEQHKYPLAAKLLKQYYIDAPIQFQTQLFAGFQKNGYMKGYDANIMALYFYSPIYYILSKNDLGVSYEECLQAVKSHVHGFCLLYKK